MVSGPFTEPALERIIYATGNKQQGSVMARQRAAAGPKVNWPWSPIPDHAHAVAAARQSSLVAGLIGISYIILALMAQTGTNPFAAYFSSGMDAGSETTFDLVFAGLAFLLAVLIHRRPRLPLVLIACLWGGAEAIAKIVLTLQLAANGNGAFIGGLFLPTIVLLVIITALRGAFLARRYGSDEVTN